MDSAISSHVERTYDFEFTSIYLTMITFRAKISSRSSGMAEQKSGPPGETEIQRLNPHRREEIIRVTNWKQLAPGSLNLEVDADVVDQLLSCTPAIKEDAKQIKYPSPYSHIPTMREWYFYYWARIKKDENTIPILIRRALKPVPCRLEAFSEFRIKDKLSLSDGDTIFCEVEQPFLPEADV